MALYNFSCNFIFHFKAKLIMLKSVIIVAGGSGKRMGKSLPKQFLEIRSKPVLMHTIEAFYNYDENIQIILVLPESEIDTWKKLIQKHNFNIEHEITEGGNERFYSVKKGLNKISSEALIAIHDGVRPFVSNTTIENCFKTAEIKGNAIPAIGINDTVRMITKEGSKMVNREKLHLIQTPQIFSSKILRKAYLQEFKKSFTDDASVVEKTGVQINLVEGNVENIKITRPIDLLLAEAIINSGFLQATQK